MDYMEIVVSGIYLIAIVLLATLLRNHKASVMQYTAQLIQSAEQAIQGSNMGAAKKALVIAQLRAAGIEVNSWLSAAIDKIVAQLNAHGAWLAQQTKQAVSGQVGTDE